ncbi:MAG TPA: hypothetical protein VIW72_07205 [Burkholderiales bacterium]
MYTFTEHNLYAVGSLAEDHNVQGLPSFRYTHGNLLCVHQATNSAS